MWTDDKEAELVAFAVQLYQKHSTENLVSTVRYDVKLPDPDGDPRQCDVITVNLDQSLKITEVQRRKRKIDKTALGQFIDKASEVGAARLDVVTFSGFTNPALTRIDREGNIRALELRALCESKPKLEAFNAWFETELDTPESTIAMNLTIDQRELWDAQTQTHLLDVAYGQANNERLSICLVHLSNTSGFNALGSFKRGPQRRNVKDKVEMELRYSDGSTTSYRSIEVLEADAF